VATITDLAENSNGAAHSPEYANAPIGDTLTADTVRPMLPVRWAHRQL